MWFLLLGNYRPQHPITPAWEGLNVPGLARRKSESAPNDGNVLNQVGFVNNTALPDSPNQLVLSKDLSGMLDKGQ
jgi:hypothetical protein